MKIKVNFLKGALLLLLIAASSSFALAQRTISGLVTDEANGETLVGASIIVTGTTKGTLTDVDGKYSLDVPTDAKSLTFSFTGYSSLTIPLGASNSVNAALKGGQSLGEVVINAGYATIKNKEITSSITSIKAEEFNRGNISDPAQLLQGKVPGLSISRAGGNPNAPFEIRLRGVSTFGANTQPLVVVDGVPGVDLATVDPNDIETMDVLKDGAASAIYGAQASSGVILVTLKKGTKNGSSVDYSGQFTSSAIANTPAIMSAEEYKKYGGPDKGSTTDWYKEISRTGVGQQHNLSLGGTAGSTNYRVGLNYRDIQGVTLKDGFKKLNGNFNLSQRMLDDKLTLGANVSITNTDAEFGFLEAFRYATTHNPTTPVKSADPAFAQYGGYHQISGFDDYNPVAIVDQSTNTGKTKHIVATAKADYQIMPGLKFGTIYTKNRRNYTNSQYYSRLGRFRGADANGQALRSSEDIENDYFSTTLTYVNEITKKLTLNALAGYDYREQTVEGFAVSAQGFPTDQMGANVLSAASRPANTALASVKDNRKLAAFFGRVNLNFDDTYFGMVSLRREGSSMFSASNQWGVFPAVSAGVALNKVLNLPQFSMLKFRVGYGVTGALPPYERLSQTNYIAQPNGGITVLRNGNPDIKWEEKAEANIGLDFGMMNNRLTGSVEYYNRKISDLFYFFENTPAGLFEATGIWANGGQMTSSGVELALSYDILKPKDKTGLAWKAGIAFGTNASVIDKISTASLRLAESGSLQTARVGAPGLNDDYMILIQEGKPLGQMWTFEYAGVDATGNPLGLAANGEKKLLKDLTAADRKVYGTGLPTAIFSLTNNFNFGDFDLSFLLRGAVGHSLIHENRIFYENNAAGSIASYNRVKTSLWRDEIKDAKWHSLYIEKADFLRIDNFQIGYNLTLPSTGAFKRARVYFSGNNIATFTNYTGVDPDVRYSDVGPADNGGRPSREFNPDPLAPGIDRRSNYFTVRSFSLGVTLGF